ncbi:MAG: hypothetical protein C4526_04130 [Nitrospiraceae bacterium]|nr:MAG: hypothetical protein C4526_04130 [Nitrospiraceae bacterium]
MELLPGKHTISASFAKTTQFIREKVTKDFNTEAGHVYIIRTELLKEDSLTGIFTDEYRIHIDDVTGKEPYETYVRHLYGIYNIK